VLFVHRWQVKICDFGMARVRSLGITMTKLGTLQWVAPEVIEHPTDPPCSFSLSHCKQVLRDERYNEKADVYSYAILVWELVARRVPYVGQNSLMVARAVAFNHLRPEVNREQCPAPLLELMEMVRIQHCLLTLTRLIFCAFLRPINMHSYNERELNNNSDSHDHS
jgi:serine/threonine protein kinase